MKNSWAGLTPRHLTQAAEFMDANPQCDGRGTLVAIVDSGVDPGADGLQKTSDGKWKFLDFIDASQLGDVDCSEVRKLDGKRTVTGLTGRQLKLPAEWKIPDDSVRLGILRGERIMTPSAVKRINKERQKQFEETAVQLNAKLRIELDKFREKANGDVAKKDAAEKKDKAAADEASELAVKNKLSLDEMKLRLELLESTVKSHSLSDPLYDCVVFHDGVNWRAVVDSTDDGDLAKAPKPLTDYDKEPGRTQRLCDLSMVNYTVHIYNEGKTLSVFTAKNSHGTHVSGIVGACYENDPDLNGVAPGCQMIGIKIGNNMERLSSLLRALRAVVHKKCDMVNMSYGEYSKTDVGGAFRKAAQELVEKHGILFTISAGNNGPNLTTGGATTPIPAAFNIGALITPKIALTDLSVVDNPKMPTTLPFPWSSCGPNRNGAVGVAVMAPGGAITTIPQNTLGKVGYKNGTSMSAPNALGCLSVVVSALKAQGISYTSQSISRALTLTAKHLPNIEPWVQGAGLIQVKDMVDELVRTAKEPSQIDNVVFNISVDGQKGIYLRDESDFPQGGTLKATASVKVVFPEETTNPEIVEFEQRLRLRCDAAYVNVAEQIVLTAASRNAFDFEIQTNHASLSPGAHFASIRAYDEKDASRTVFDLPVTICKPSTSSAAEEKQSSVGRSAGEVITLVAGQPVRRFFQPPPGATSAAINFEALSPIKDRYTMIFAAAYIHPHRSFNETSTERYITIEDERKETLAFKCHPGRTIEVLFMKNWRSAGDDSQLRFNVDFTCLTCSPSTVLVPAGHLTSKVEVTSHLLNTRIKPAARVTEFDRSIAASTWSITPLDDRDRTLSEQPKFQLLLDYKISMNFATKVRPIWALLYDALYESHFDGGFWQMFDSNGVFVAGEDTFNSKNVSLKKAEYTMKLQVIHPDISTLEKLSKMPCVLRMKLSSDVTLKLYPSQNSAAIELHPVGAITLKQGSTRVFWLRAPTENPKNTKSGDMLRGYFTPGTDSALGGTVCKPGACSASFPLLCGVGAPTSPKEAADDSAITKAAEPKDERTAAEKFRDYQIKMIDGMDDKMLEDTGKTVLDELLKAHPDSIEVQLLQLRVLSKPKKKDGDLLKKIGDITETIVAKIPSEEIAAYFGLPSLDSDVVDAAKKKKMEELRAQLREAYELRAKALFEVVSPHFSSTTASSDEPSSGDEKEGEAVKEALSDKVKDTFQAAFADLFRWTPKAKRSSLVRMNVVYEIGRGFPAKALKLLNEEIKNAVPAKKELHTLRLGLYEHLGWANLLLESERLAIVHQFAKIPLSYT